MPDNEELNATFCRRCYLLYLIETSERPSVPRLMALTGWPRRTIQDALKRLLDMDARICFLEDGKRHNDGYYQLQDWGAINPAWVRTNLARIKAVLSVESAD